MGVGVWGWVVFYYTTNGCDMVRGSGGSEVEVDFWKCP